MPLFIIISGYFFKEQDLKKFIINTFKRLILPYVITVFFIDIFEYIRAYNTFNLIEMLKDFFQQIMLSYAFLSYSTQIKALGPLWFLPFLAVLRIIFFICKKIIKENEFALAVTCIFITYIGYILGINRVWLPFSVDVAMACTIFYYVGYIFKKYNLLEKTLKDNKTLLIMLFIWILSIKFGSIEIAIRSYPNSLFCFISAIAGSLIVMKISMIINDKIKLLSKILKWFGRNSVYILAFHTAESALIDYSFINNFISNASIYKLLVSVIKMCIITCFTQIYILLKDKINKLLYYIRKKKSICEI